MQKNIFITGIVAAATGAAAALFVVRSEASRGNAPGHAQGGQHADTPSLFTSQSAPSAGAIDLTYAAEKSVNAVVHVKTSYMREQNVPESIFEFFYGFRRYQEPAPVVQGAGSGVIISTDGYIVTNNHVIERANEIHVTLNDRRTFTAKLVGTDPSTDIAVLKIEGSDLPYITIGNSDALRLGEWVLAVGNPLNLTSTVTAGIVSAKARNINILSDDFKIESFIQTDAAVNQGNSGGALVNARGELVGINTAIASPTGSFAGYSFAVPSSIVNKVSTDIIEFGVVQRAVLGVSLQELTPELAAEYGIQHVNGVLIYGVLEGGAAAQADLQKGDVVTKINDVEVSTVAQLQEQISKFRPNDQVSLTIVRSNKTKYVNIILRNKAGTTSLVKADSDNALHVLGASLKEVDANTKRALRIRGGVQVAELKQGMLMSQGVKKGYIITSINRTPVNSVHDISKILSTVQNEAVLIEGIYPNGTVAYYAIGMSR
ncbi:MAG: Do family serine endopeptidase [Prevotellaceae bacterium]|jgi:Do/DeqQ family serine protease|nr:Do family serine endopeptidase [Prevotellaceae bacterium]